MNTVDQLILTYYKDITPNEGWNSPYSLGPCKEMRLRKGIAWTRPILRDGMTVGDVENNGDGGCHWFSFPDLDIQEDFEALADEAYLGRDITERTDTLVNWMDMAQDMGAQIA